MGIQEIESAIIALPPRERSKLLDRLDEYRAEEWDKQIEEDAKSGRLDHLIEEAKEDYRAGRTRPL